MDRLHARIEETELVEIVRNNLLAEIKDKLLFEEIFSIAQLRRLVQKHENFLRKIDRMKPSQPKSKDAGGYRVYTLEKQDNIDEDLENDAVNEI